MGEKIEAKLLGLVKKLVVLNNLVVVSSEDLESGVIFCRTSIDLVVNLSLIVNGFQISWNNIRLGWLTSEEEIVSSESTDNGRSD